MSDTTAKSEPARKPAAERKKPGTSTISPAARRALEEAENRRGKIDARTRMAPREKGGRGGLDPARFGDWEVKGLTSDF